MTSSDTERNELSYTIFTAMYLKTPIRNVSNRQRRRRRNFYENANRRYKTPSGSLVHLSGFIQGSTVHGLRSVLSFR